MCGFPLYLKFPQSRCLHFHAMMRYPCLQGYGLGSRAVLGCSCPRSLCGDAGVGQRSRFGCCAPAPELGRAPARCPLLLASHSSSGRDPASWVKTRQERARRSRALAAPLAAAARIFAMGFEGCRIRPAAAGLQCWAVHVVPCPKRGGDARSGAGRFATAAVSQQRYGGHWVARPPSWLCHIPTPCTYPMAKPGRGLVASPPQPLVPQVLPGPCLPPPAATSYGPSRVCQNRGAKLPLNGRSPNPGAAFSPPIR